MVKKVEPNLVRETVSQATSDFIRHALFMTVDDEEGTGKAGRVAGYKVGGKTGTAEKPRSAQTTISYPSVDLRRADDPQLLVYVVIDTPGIFRAKSRRTALSPQRFSRRSWRKRFHT